MRRHQSLFLAGSLASTSAIQNAIGENGIPLGPLDRIRGYLAGLVRTQREVHDWLAGTAFPFGKYDSELGFLHRDRRFKEGTEDSICTYTYDTSGARHAIMHASKPCRINTYGNSFTSCEQVSDGETWQEVLAAFLGEPVRNYGIGGYSVYQAYLRMKREERLNPAQYIIFNIFDDDHYRNQISWQVIRYGKNWQHFQPPLPYIVANPATGQFVEMKNACPTPESLYNLCNLDWVYQTFKDDFVLKMRLAQEAEKNPDREIAQMVEALAAEQGMSTRVNSSGDDLVNTANSLYTRSGIFASMRVVDQIETFATAHKKKVLYVLSYGSGNVAKRLLSEKRFDQSFVDFLQSHKLPYVDLLEAHAADYAQFRCSVEDYFRKYYVPAHYNPRGNRFCAFAVLSKLLSILDPKPAPYSGSYDCSAARCSVA